MDHTRMLSHFLEKGSIAFPTVLFLEYKRLALSEKEVMLLIHLILFQEKEQNTFPTVSQLRDRMNIPSKEIISLLQSLVRGGFLLIEEEVNKEGLRSERYCTSPFIRKISESYAKRGEEDATNKAYDTLFHLFEKEFGRALSPLECEALSQWIDEDGYKEELIETALREAVFCGKVNFRYIDRLLLDWQRNHIRTKEEAMNYVHKFRQQKGTLYQAPRSESKRERSAQGFSFYNWIHHK